MSDKSEQSDQIKKFKEEFLPQALAQAAAAVAADPKQNLDTEYRRRWLEHMQKALPAELWAECALIPPPTDGAKRAAMEAAAKAKAPAEAKAAAEAGEQARAVVRPSS